MSDAVVNGLAGARGGIVAQLLTYPLQAVRFRSSLAWFWLSRLASWCDLGRVTQQSVKRSCECLSRSCCYRHSQFACNNTTSAESDLKLQESRMNGGRMELWPVSFAIDFT